MKRGSTGDRGAPVPISGETSSPPDVVEEYEGWSDGPSVHTLSLTRASTYPLQWWFFLAAFVLLLIGGSVFAAIRGKDHWEQQPQQQTGQPIQAMPTGMNPGPHLDNGGIV